MEPRTVTQTRIKRDAGLVALTALAALAFPGAAHAGSQQTTMGVSATVTANCTISAGSVAFGNINPMQATNWDATGTLTVSCTNGSAWSISADAGSTAGATMTSRRMTSGANTLNYALYTTSARNVVWGDGTGTTAVVSGTGTGGSQSVTIYGRIPSGQTSAPTGPYADTVNITITY